MYSYNGKAICEDVCKDEAAAARHLPGTRRKLRNAREAVYELQGAGKAGRVRATCFWLCSRTVLEWSSSLEKLLNAASIMSLRVLGLLFMCRA